MNSFFIIKTLVRTLFTMTSRKRAIDQTRRLLESYLALADGLRHEEGSRPVTVPPMRGVDEDMRDWSFYMVLEHNTLVNYSISAMVRQLARNEPLSGPALIDPKKDVMPSPSADEAQVARFRASVNDHLDALKSLGRLRGTRQTRHPVFGDFDAHKWNCMFPFHLKLHYDQAEYVVRSVRAA